MSNPVESIFLYNSAGTYIMEIDPYEGITVDEAFEYAFKVAEKSGIEAGSFGIEVRQVSDLTPEMARLYGAITSPLEG